MKKFSIFTGTVPIYNLNCSKVDLPGTTANLLGCRLAPGEISEGHNHFEMEVFLFAQGEGRVEQNGMSLPIKAGDVVLFESFENHIIVNGSSTESLLFYSVYWCKENTRISSHPTTVRPALIFSTPPTPNGDLHLGHLSGPYMAADSLSRCLRAAGRPVRHVTGRDDNQTYVMTCGLREGRTPEETADYYDAMIRDTWDKFGIEIDSYVKPSSSVRYAEFVRYGIDRLRKKGLIIAKIEPAAIDVDGRYLHEAFINGACPYCGESSDGNACEACGRPNNCTDLKGASAKLSGTPIRTELVERLYFRLSALSEKLSQYIKTANMPAHVAALSLDMIEDGLPDICISHPGPWGMDLAIDGFEGHKVYVWFEMAFGYLWGAADLPEACTEEILAAAAAVYDGRSDIAHCYGFDNAYYHTLLFPAVHMALGLSPARTHVVNELLDLDGKKFSTSRRHLIWGRDFIKTVSRDYARFAVMLNRPESLRENFVVEKVLDDLNETFFLQLNSWSNRLSKRLKIRDNYLPEPGSWLVDHRQFHEWIMAQADLLDISEKLETFSPRRIAHIIHALIIEGNRFSVSQTYLADINRSSSNNYARTVIALEVLALAILARACRAIMPDLADKLTETLGLQTHDGRKFLASDHQIAGVLKLDLPPVDKKLAMKLLEPSTKKSLVL